MTDISFVPSFRHTDFLDDDVVRAGEPNGFNARFNAIQTDLLRLSTVVAEVSAALGQGSGVARQRRLDLPPAFLASGSSQPWTAGVTGAATVAAGKSASGLLRANLPASVHLLSLRAFGQAAGATPAISLLRVPIAGGTAQLLASVTGDANPFDRIAPVDASVSLTVPATFRYLVRATVPTLPDGASVTVAGVQITYSLD